MCLINIKIICPHCHSSKVVKNGVKSTGRQNFLCKSCSKQFQWEYLYRGADPSVKSQALSGLLHGNGVRDCLKVFGLSPTTTLNTILSEGKKVQIKARKHYYERIEIDEMYSFVNSKGKKVWIFYAYAPETKEILAVTMGKRSRKQLKNLMVQLKCLHIKVGFYCTDAFEGFKKLFPEGNHLIGKQFTKNIEGINTLLRSKIARLDRRTTKFSKKLKYQWYLFKIIVDKINRMPSYI